MHFIKRFIAVLGMLVIIASGIPCLVSDASEPDVIYGVRSIPNPFRAGYENTSIRYYLHEDCSITIKIFNLAGGLVVRFSSDECPGSTGNNLKEWDGRNGLERAVADGCYIWFPHAARRGRGDRGLRLDRDAAQDVPALG